MDWQTLLADITGTVDQELLWRNEYLVTENRMRRHQIQGCVRLSDGERTALAEAGQQLVKLAREAVATIVKPDTILAWHRDRIAALFRLSSRAIQAALDDIDQHHDDVIARYHCLRARQKAYQHPPEVAAKIAASRRRAQAQLAARTSSRLGKEAQRNGQHHG